MVELLHLGSAGPCMLIIYMISRIDMVVLGLCHTNVAWFLATVIEVPQGGSVNRQLSDDPLIAIVVVYLYGYRLGCLDHLT